jgi:hypothetical protein
MGMETLQVGIGSSNSPDARCAGAWAARRAVAQLGDATPALVIVYASVGLDLPELLAGVRGVTGETALVGASSSGQFHDGGLSVGDGVSVLAMTAGNYSFGIASSTGLAADAFAVGAAVARAARDAVGPQRPEHSAILLFSDGAYPGDPQSLLSGVYRVAGAAVPVVGGSASDGGRSTHHEHRGTFVFHDDAVLSDGAVAVWIGSPRPLTVACAHGWRSGGLPLLVTAVEGRVVSEIGGRPAAEVFRENVGLDAPGRETAHPETGATHAFGLVEPDGTEVIRGASIDAVGVLRTWVPLALYSAVRVVSGTPEDLLLAGEQVVEAALAGLSRAQPGTATGAGVLLAFGCAARMEILGERRDEEAKRMQATAGEVPTFGFYTCGEFARTTNVAGYHNAAITAVAL